MAHVIVAGGGLAGMAAATALASAGIRVTLFEARSWLGGRATSYEIPGPEGKPRLIDNSPHILLRCCLNLLDFYASLGVDLLIDFHSRIHFLEPGGRCSSIARCPLPPPLHLLPSFACLPFLSLKARYRIARAFLSAGGKQPGSCDADHLTFDQWLHLHHQPEDAVRCFWRPLVVSALNEEPETCSAAAGLQVLRLAFLQDASGFELGIPRVPLRRLYQPILESYSNTINIVVRAPVTRIQLNHDAVSAVESRQGRYSADAYILALPRPALARLLPDLSPEPSLFRPVPITAIHLWFDRPVTHLPSAALLGRTIQWFFAKDGGSYLQLVISASRSLTAWPRTEIIRMALAELAEFLPGSRSARLIHSHVVKELQATFSPTPGLEMHRPPNRTRFRNLFLAGDWTRSGWPSTMEGAVRSGRLAAEQATAALGNPRRFLIPDPC